MSSTTEPSDPRTAELAELIAACPWLVGVLVVVRDAGLPDAWVGAGVLRDLVWGRRYGGGFDPWDVRDVDVAFFDPDDLTRGGDVAARRGMAAQPAQSDGRAVPGPSRAPRAEQTVAEGEGPAGVTSCGHC